MGELKRATIYLEPHLHRALKLKAAEVDRTLSDLVNEALRHSLMEDAIDLQAIEERKNQPEHPLEWHTAGGAPHPSFDPSDRSTYLDQISKKIP